VSVWGKIIGGVTGFAMGGPLGSFLGVIAGHAVDRSRGQATERIVHWSQGHPEQHTYSQEERQIAFSIAVIVLGAKLAKVDGVVTRAEVDAFKEIFRIPPEDVAEVAKVFDEARHDSTGFELYAQQAAELFSHQPHVLEELLGGLILMAKADGMVSPHERSYLRSVANIFGFYERTFNRLLASHLGGMGGSDKIDPYAVLGIYRRTSDADIKKTYRQLIRENHPDTLIAQGMPSEFVAAANGKMAAINAAYDLIEKERGLR
jgi:DnaJ like chaperone protein